MKTVARRLPSMWTLAVLCAAVVGLSSATTHGGPGTDVEDIENPLVVIKSTGNPSRNVVTRDWTSPLTGTWHQWGSNSGLRALSIELREETDGTSTVIYSCKIAFSVADAYPSGIVELEDVKLTKDRSYKLILEPQGRRGASAEYFHAFEGVVPPLASFTCEVSGVTVYVDALASTSETSIVNYTWDFDLGVTSYGMTHTHTYISPGGYLITLTIEDEIGQKDSCSKIVSITQSVPPDAYWCVAYGTTYAADGKTPIERCMITVTNLRTKESMVDVCQSYSAGAYMCDVSVLAVLVGDELLVQAVGPSGESGTATAVRTDMFMVQVNLVLS